MARVTLELPAELPFSCELRIRVTDLNYGGHLGNDSVMSLMHEARALFFVHLGYTELDAEGVSFIMGDCVIVFRSEGFFNQNLICEVGCGDFSRAACDMYYRLRHLDPGTGAPGPLLAEAKTGLVCYDYSTKKVRSIPSALRDRLANPSLASQPENT